MQTILLVPLDGRETAFRTVSQTQMKLIKPVDKRNFGFHFISALQVYFNGLLLGFISISGKALGEHGEKSSRH